MDTVSMLNTMSFYCQPILPLVYDESMSYYETLCKVVGQLNITGETVNKLTEGLTNEIADRQAADTALDERLKKIEEADKRIHFLVFDGANPNGGMPTRGELYQWVHEGHAIFTLFRTNEEGRGQIYAASCSYNAGNWGSEASNDFNIIVPIETSYDATQDYAVKQKVAKLAIPLSPQTDLNVPWRLQIIEINTPSTSAEGVVNLTASITGSNVVNCSITPSEFLQLYNMTRGNKRMCVAVNARLEYDAHTRSSSTASVDTTSRTIRIAFELDHGIYSDNGVKRLNKTLDYIIGDANTDTWTHESISSAILDYPRHEAFQFTRVAGNVITANVDSTPNAVYAHYTADTSGKLFQNLPVRLIDTVDNAEYWNGTFDIYNGNHMTFTFVTSNYATASDKMLVRVIELSADTDTNTWKYGVKEFEVPYRPTAYVLDVWQTNDTPSIVNGYVSYDSGSNLDFDDLLPLVEGNQKFVATLHKGDSDKGIEWSGLVYSSNLINNGIGRIVFATTEGVTLNNGIPSMHGVVVFTKDSTGVKKVVTTFSSALPAPSSDGADNGKVPIVNGTKWELKAPTGGASDFIITATLDDNNNCTVDKTYAQIQEAVQAGKKPVVRLDQGGSTVTMPLVASGGYFGFAGSIMVNPPFSANFVVSIQSNNEVVFDMAYGLGLDHDSALPQVNMASAPTRLMEIATKGYVDNNIKVDSALDSGSIHAVQNKVVTAALDEKLNKTEPAIQGGGFAIESPAARIQIYTGSQTSATGGDFASLDMVSTYPGNAADPVVITGLANFGDAEAAGHSDTAVSYAQLVEYTTPLMLNYADSQVTGASYTDIRKAIERGRQIKLVVANIPDIIAASTKNETDKSVLKFVDTVVGDTGATITQYTVTAQASGVTVATKSVQLT